ncbi:phage neck terminator protein [Serratia proteamaculans]
MSNDSTSTGYLTPTSTGPDYDEALERELSRWVRAVSGLPAGMVKPRWTPVQSAQPPADVNWCGFGITDFNPDANPAFIQQGDDRSEMWRHEVIECMASFYGPGGQGIGTQFRDGVTVSQNNETLNATGLTLFDVSKLTPFPELINNQWVRRYDITVRLRRKVIREYGIKSLAEAPVTFFGD